MDNSIITQALPQVLACDPSVLRSSCPGLTLPAIERKLSFIELSFPNDFEIESLLPQGVKCWRTLCRIACVNVSNVGRLGANLRLGRSLELINRHLGASCPRTELIKNDRCGGFRALAVALSSHIGALVTPRQAYLCFGRAKHQGLELTEYGHSLLGKYGRKWPPSSEQGETSLSTKEDEFNLDNLWREVFGVDFSPLDLQLLESLPDEGGERSSCRGSDNGGGAVAPGTDFSALGFPGTGPHSGVSIAINPQALQQPSDTTTDCSSIVPLEDCYGEWDTHRYIFYYYYYDFIATRLRGGNNNEWAETSSDVGGGSINSAKHSLNPQRIPK